MDDSKFWDLIEESKRKAKGDFDDQAESLLGLLRKLPPEDIVQFDRIYHDRLARAYTWDLWGAAYVIGGGCSDDGFDYFRDWLISRGRTVYEAALRVPESLVEAVTTADADEHCEFEDFRYVALRAWEARTGRGEDEFPAEQGMQQPDEPTGEAWQEDDSELARRFPRLSAKFG
jgi:hypothetical protein